MNSEKSVIFETCIFGSHSKKVSPIISPGPKNVADDHSEKLTARSRKNFIKRRMVIDCIQQSNFLPQNCLTPHTLTVISFLLTQQKYATKFQSAVFIDD